MIRYVHTIFNFYIYLENKLLLISINFTPKTSLTVAPKKLYNGTWMSQEISKWLVNGL